MEIALDPDLERQLRAKVAAGIYETIDEAVQWGIWLMLQQDEGYERGRAAFNREIGEACAEADAGDFVDGPAFFRELHSRNKVAG